jgi:hypothetical protein
VIDFVQLRESDELGMSRSRADDQDLEVIKVAQKRPGADEGIEILRMTDVARVHDDELLVDTPAS